MIKQKLKSILRGRIYNSSNFYDNLPTEAMPALHMDHEENFYVHIHLPKTGGSTFNSSLEKNFGECFEAFQGRFIHFYPILSTEKMLGFIKKHPGIKAVASHNFNAKLPYRNNYKNVISIAFIRNPVDKFFSFYFHMRHRHGVSCIQKEMLLGDYINYHYGNLNKGKLSGYLNQLVGSENQYSFEYLKSLVERGNLILFNTDYMENAMTCLHTKFPKDFYDLNILRENISLKDQNVCDEHRSKVQAMISDYDWKLLELTLI